MPRPLLLLPFLAPSLVALSPPSPNAPSPASPPSITPAPNPRSTPALHRRQEEQVETTTYSYDTTAGNRWDYLGFKNPADAGGRMLDFVPGTYPRGLGEPLNVIISGNSDPDVLKDSELKGGMQNFWWSINFSGECLGQSSGQKHAANLGDGRGQVNQTAVMRYNYGDQYLGSCQETILGWNHFRYWIQEGTGAYFLATSVEMSLELGHDIHVDGYDFGRDILVGNATNSPIYYPLDNTTSPPHNGSVYVGRSSFNSYTYETTATYVAGLLQNSSNGINHYITVEKEGRSAIDGLVAVMEVHIVERPLDSSAIRTLVSFAALLAAAAVPLVAGSVW